MFTVYKYSYCTSPSNSISKIQKMSMSCIKHVGKDDSGCRHPSPPMAHIVVAVTDRSGSMYSMDGAPPRQIHEQMKDLAETAKKLDVPTYFTLITFDDKMETPIENSNLQTDDIPSLAFLQDCLNPRGMTKLYDSGCHGLKLLLNQKNSLIASLPKKVRVLNPEIKTSYVLLTDGGDNSSGPGGQERHFCDLNKMREQGTMAIFLGANIDAASTGEYMGFAADTSIQMTPTFEGASQCMRAVSNSLRRASTGSNNQSVDIDEDFQQVNHSPVQQPIGMSPGMPLGLPPGMPPGLRLRRY